MKLRHWIKEYRFRKADQRTMTKYWQRMAALILCTKKRIKWNTKKFVHQKWFTKSNNNQISKPL